MICHFGFYEEYKVYSNDPNAIAESRWRGVAMPMPDHYWYPTEHDSWIFATSEDKIIKLLEQEIKELSVKCEQALKLNNSLFNTNNTSKISKNKANTHSIPY